MTTTTTSSASPSSAARDDAATAATMRLLVADKFEASGLDAARALGMAVEFLPDLTADALPDAVRTHDPDVLIVRSTKVPDAVFEAAGRLALVIRAGAGYDNIDVAAASRRGVFVANCPGRNAQAVAELAWGLILACDRRIPDQTADLRAGVWNKKGYAKADGLYGRTLGIIGLGRIGHAVAACAPGFGMRTIAWSRSLTPEAAETHGFDYAATPLDVARAADVVSVHVAATADTRNLIDEAFLAAMKPGAILVNTSRGSVVDADALAKAARDKGIRAGLDVWAKQPTPSDKTFADPTIETPGVIGTHHVGASTNQAQEAIAAESVRILETFARTGEVPNCVNRAAASPATGLLTVRHLNRTGVLAHVLHILSDAGINVEEMENIIFEDAKAACARIRLDDTPSDEHLRTIRDNENILSVSVTPVERG